MQVGSTRRQDVARGLASLAGFSATALLVVPKGLSIFACLMLAATLVALPDTWRRGRPVPRALYALLAVSVGVILVVAVSTWRTEAPLSALDNPSRALLLPWCAWLVGVERVGSDANPIVFANAVLTLLVIAVFCRPSTRGWPLLLVLAAILMANVAVILSGSRGVLPGLGLVVLMLLMGNATPQRWWRLGAALGVLALLFVALWTVPWLSQQFRLDELHGDVAGFAAGAVDKPISARMALLSVAWDAFRESPLTGVGVDTFAARIDASTYCLDAHRHFCGLGHAHNDVAQWGATLGVLGLAALAALYLGPLWIAARAIQGVRPDMPVGPAWAAVMLVATYGVSGMTQSMFSHALSTSAFFVFGGLLLGCALRSAQTAGKLHSH